MSSQLSTDQMSARVHDPGQGVHVENLSKVYHPSPGWMKAMARSYIKDDVVALDGISFRVDPGEICAVVGPNGAGKTTTFRILVGLTTSSSGTATVMGHDCTRESRQIRHLIGWMPADERSLVMRLSCAENLYFHGRLHGLKGEDLRERVRETLALVDLAHAAESSVFALSAGMKARLQLARALLTRPRVLILDEPTGSVDPVASYELLQLIMDIVQQQELAALISSHRLEEIEALHSHAILLDKGLIRFDGDLDVLREQLDRPTVELKFDSDQSARAVNDLISKGDLGEVVALEGPSLQIVLRSDVPVGRFLSSLGSTVAELIHIREFQTPLRDLLAQMYRDGREAPL